MLKNFDKKIDEYIQKVPDDKIIGVIYGQKVIGKNFSNIHLAVKISRNLFNEGFWNMDICYVLGETRDEKLVVQRIDDQHIGIVDKKDVRYPEWKQYEF